MTAYKGDCVKLAIFDLDNTLIAGDSDHSWGEFLTGKGLVNADEYRRKNDLFYQAYKNGTLDMNAYLEFSLAPLARHTLDELQVFHDEFMRLHIEPIMLPKAQALLALHRQRGDFLLIITATNSFITHPIGAHLGVDHIMATDAEMLEDRYTGRPLGTPCFREGKVTRLQSWIAQQGFSLDGSYFYSDSINDLPLLQEVANPVAVDPDDLLLEQANQRGWPVISLRDELPLTHLPSVA